MSSSKNPTDRKYTKDHEWALVQGDLVVVGITWYAQSKLKDVVFVELPKVGKKVNKSEAVAVVESVKTAADVYAPVSGTIVEVNKELETNPEFINKDPYGKGWMFKIKPTNLEKEWQELLDASEYEKLTQ
ncbi:MAG: glycine cleavage system protein GcvH [Thermoproteota archaeon]|jgi:glycine cleavage system H protein